MKNFVIVGTQRIGSTAIAASLDLHPLVSCGWEWTQRAAWPRKISIAQRALNGDFSSLPEKHRQHMTRVFSDTVEWLGYRRLFRASSMWWVHPSLSPTLLVDRLEAHLRWFASQPELHIIHIVRNDGIAWLKSKYLANATRNFSGKEYTPGIKVRIPIRDAVARLRAKQWVDGRLATLELSNPYLKLAYEDFLEQSDQVVSSALRFLGCAPTIGSGEGGVNKRQSKGTSADYISNYEQLVSELQKRGLLGTQQSEC